MHADGYADLRWALPIAMVVLLMPPVLLLFDRHVLIGGIPLLHVYLFVVWLAFILATRWLARRLTKSTEPADEPRDRS